MPPPHLARTSLGNRERNKHRVPGAVPVRLDLGQPRRRALRLWRSCFEGPAPWGVAGGAQEDWRGLPPKMKSGSPEP